MNKLILLGVSLLVVAGLWQYVSTPAPVETVLQDIEPTDDVVETDDGPSANDTKTPSATEETQTPATGSVINLSNKSLTGVPMSIFSQSGATVLNLSGNRLDGSLPAEVRHLSQLKELNLSDNNFTGVPAEVGQLSKLEILNLSNNPLTGLPYELGNLKNLEILDLRGTNYSQVDLEIIKSGLSASVLIKI